MTQKEKQEAPKHGFDYNVWLSLLDLEFVHPKKTDAGVETPEIQNEEPEDDVSTRNPSCLDQQIEEFDEQYLIPRDLFNDDELGPEKNSTLIETQVHSSDGNEEDLEPLHSSSKNSSIATTAKSGVWDEAVLFLGEQTSSVELNQDNSECDDDVNVFQEGDDIEANEEEASDDDMDTLILQQYRQPRKDDKVLFYSIEKESWQIITLTSSAIARFRKEGWYYNFIYSDSKKDGTFLYPGKPYWGLISPEEAAHLDVNKIIPQLANNEGKSQEEHNIKQLDGGVTPESLSPVTTSPEEERKKVQQYTETTENSSSLNANLSDEENVEEDFVNLRVHLEFIDDDYEDQSSICGDTAEEHFLNELVSRTQSSPEIKQEGRNGRRQSTEASWSCYPMLTLDERIVPNKKYRLPNVKIVEEAKPQHQHPEAESHLQQHDQELRCEQPAVPEHQSNLPRRPNATRSPLQRFVSFINSLQIFKKT